MENVEAPFYREEELKHLQGCIAGNYESYCRVLR